MELHLVDSSPEVAQALASQFRLFPEIDVCCDDILSVGSGAVVSPANGHGYLDGGIDHAYLERFGLGFAGRVRDACNARPEGHLPVGASAIVRTGSLPIEFVILAPTMVMPEAVPASHAGRALAAVLRIAGTLPSGTPVYCPGLATGVGQVSPEEAASSKAQAYRRWLGSRPGASS